MAIGGVIHEREIGIYRLVFVEQEDGVTGVAVFPREGYTAEQAEAAYMRDMEALTAHNLAQMSGSRAAEEPVQ